MLRHTSTNTREDVCAESADSISFLDYERCIYVYTSFPLFGFETRKLRKENFLIVV